MQALLDAKLLMMATNFLSFPKCKTAWGRTVWSGNTTFEYCLACYFVTYLNIRWGVYYDKCLFQPMRNQDSSCENKLFFQLGEAIIRGETISKGISLFPFLHFLPNFRCSYAWQWVGIWDVGSATPRDQTVTKCCYLTKLLRSVIIRWEYEDQA